MKNRISFAFLILLSGFIFQSCEKVIEVDLNSSNPRTVIEANISDQPGPYIVRISKSTNFDETNIFPGVTGAVVTFSDDAGNSETLTETTPGNYITSSFPQGVAGRTYTLDITAEGKNYHAVSILQPPVEIDSLTTKPLFDDNLSVVVHFQDPADRANFYRYTEMHNGEKSKIIFVQDDEFRNGLYIKQNLFPFYLEDSTKLYTGDSVTIMMQSIDVGAYEYFRTLTQITESGGNQVASPANPTSNISNNALGYFSAYSVRSKTLIVQ